MHSLRSIPVFAVMAALTLAVDCPQDDDDSATEEPR